MLRNVLSSVGLHIYTLACGLLCPVVTYAVAGPTEVPTTLIPDHYQSCDFANGIIGTNCIPEYIGYLIKLLFALIGAFFLLAILFAGYQIAIGTVVGEKEKGKERLKWAIVGFIVSALAFFIVQFFISALLNGI